MQHPRLIHENRGFTLIELVLVIVILAVISMSVVPKYVDMQKDAELAVAQRFGAALKEGSSHFVMKRVTRGQSVGTLTFADFVAFQEPGPAGNTVAIEGSLLNDLANPTAPIAGPSDGWTTVTLTFRSGAVATYTIDPATHVITDVYTGFTNGGGGCGG